MSRDQRHSSYYHQATDRDVGGARQSSDAQGYGSHSPPLAHLGRDGFPHPQRSMNAGLETLPYEDRAWGIAHPLQLPPGAQLPQDETISFKKRAWGIAHPLQPPPGDYKPPLPPLPLSAAPSSARGRPPTGGPVPNPPGEGFVDPRVRRAPFMMMPPSTGSGTPEASLPPPTPISASQAQAQSSRHPPSLHPAPSPAPYSPHLSSGSGMPPVFSGGGPPHRHDITMMPDDGMARPMGGSARSQGPLTPDLPLPSSRSQQLPSSARSHHRHQHHHHYRHTDETASGSKGSSATYQKPRPVAVFDTTTSEHHSRLSPPLVSSQPPSPPRRHRQHAAWYGNEPGPRPKKRSRHASPPATLPITPMTGQGASLLPPYPPSRSSMPPRRAGHGLEPPEDPYPLYMGSSRRRDRLVRKVSPDSPPSRASPYPRETARRRDDPSGSSLSRRLPVTGSHARPHASLPPVTRQLVQESVDRNGKFAHLPRMHRGASRYAELEAQRVARESMRDGWFQLGPVVPRDVLGWSKADSDSYKLGYQDALYAVQEGVIGIGNMRYKRPHLAKDVPDLPSLGPEGAVQDSMQTLPRGGAEDARDLRGPPGVVAPPSGPPLLSPVGGLMPGPPPPGLPPPPRSRGHLAGRTSPHLPGNDYDRAPAHDMHLPFARTPQPPGVPLPPTGSWAPDVLNYNDIPRAVYYESYQGPGSSSYRPGSPAYSETRPMRALISCYPCRTRKLKCDGLQPCSQCLRRLSGDTCKFADVVRRRGKGKKTLQSEEDSQSEASFEILEREPEPVREPDLEPEPVRMERGPDDIKHEPRSTGLSPARTAAVVDRRPQLKLWRDDNITSNDDGTEAEEHDELYEEEEEQQQQQQQQKVAAPEQEDVKPIVTDEPQVHSRNPVPPRYEQRVPLPSSPTSRLPPPYVQPDEDGGSEQQPPPQQQESGPDVETGRSPGIVASPPPRHDSIAAPPPRHDFIAAPPHRHDSIAAPPPGHDSISAPPPHRHDSIVAPPPHLIHPRPPVTLLPLSSQAARVWDWANRSHGPYVQAWPTANRGPGARPMLGEPFVVGSVQDEPERDQPPAPSPIARRPPSTSPHG